MDYAFRSGRKKRSIEIHLGGHEIVVISDKSKHIISYTEIKEVRLNKKRDTYFLTISALNYGSLIIQSQTFTESGNRIDQTRIYTAFIRVLHMHLLEKSKVDFVTGFSFGKIFSLLRIWILLCSLIFVIENSFDFIPGNQSFMVVLILVTGPLLYLGFQQSKWPRSYSPTSIPLTMLPAAH